MKYLNKSINIICQEERQIDWVLIFTYWKIFIQRRVQFGFTIIKSSSLYEWRQSKNRSVLFQFPFTYYSI